MKGYLIYSCRHCGEMHYEEEPREYLLDQDGTTTVRISEEGDVAKVPLVVWHRCFSKSGGKPVFPRSAAPFPHVFMGRCDLVGIKEHKEPENKENG